MTLFVPGRIVNPTNARWSKFGQRVTWARTWRDATDNALLHWWATHPEAQREVRGWVFGGAIAVQCTARVARKFDTDGLQAAIKPVRDQIAKAFGVSDGPDGGCRWSYGQVVDPDPARRGVVVQISRVASERRTG